MLEAHAAGATLVATDAGIAPLLAADQLIAMPGHVLEMANAIEKAFAGSVKNKSYVYPYASRKEYLDMYRVDIERAAQK